MKVLAVIAHANPRSFNHAVLDSFTRGLKDGGHEVEVVDLYAIGFDPRLTVEEFAFEQAKDSKPMLDQVLEQQDKVARADALAFIYPVIWMDFPAILKGWIERVFSAGFAWDVDEAGLAGHLKGRLPLLKHQKALSIATTHWSEEDYRNSGFLDAMEKITVDYALKYPGIKQAEMVMLYSVAVVDDDTRKEYLDRAYRLGREF
jgi:NAD(P)H dehydrogenase (quinone)